MQTIYKNQPSFNLILDVPPVEQGIRQFWTLTNQAKLNNLNFKIVYKEPFKLEDYLKPASIKHNWIADYKDLEYSIQYTRFVNENKKFSLHASKNKQYHCYNYTGDICPRIFSDSGFKWNSLFSELFVPNDEIKLAIMQTGLKRKEYNAIHLRFVNALENFEKGYYNNLKTEAEKLQLISRCKTAIRDVCKYSEQEGINTVVVFSDSERFLSSLSDVPVLTLDTTSIGHISFNNSHAEIIKTFLDFYMISMASKVYRIVAEEMYKSSCFALCAARAGDAEFINIEV